MSEFWEISASNVKVKLCNLGALPTAMTVADRDILVGCDDVSGYEKAIKLGGNNPFFGTVGRVANR